MSDTDEETAWVLILPHLPGDPARHRMALWRRLRRCGAIPLGQGTWALPDLPATEPILHDLQQLVAGGTGSLLVLRATGHRPGDRSALRAGYTRARAEEWSEFHADCDKYLAELAKEHRLGKYTLAELEEEEQSVDRLRRWYRDLRARDPLGLAPTAEGTRVLKQCEQAFDGYAERVYRQIGEPRAD